MKSEQLKREFAEKYKKGTGYISFEKGEASYSTNADEIISDLNAIIEAVIAERMPSKQEISDEAQKYDKYYRGKFYAFKLGAEWFRSRMEGKQ